MLFTLLVSLLVYVGFLAFLCFVFFKKEQWCKFIVGILIGLMGYNVITVLIAVLAVVFGII